MFIVCQELFKYLEYRPEQQWQNPCSHEVYILLGVDKQHKQADYLVPEGSI